MTKSWYEKNRPRGDHFTHSLWQILFETNRTPTVAGFKTASKLQFSQRCIVIKNLFSIKKLLSSKCHMITCSKRDHLHVRPKMSRVKKCNTKTPWLTPPLTSRITGQLVSEYNQHSEGQDAWVAWCHQLSAPPEVVYHYSRQVSPGETAFALASS